MHFNIQRIVAGILGTLVSVKFLFWLFTPTEIMTTTLIWIVVFLAYGIQRVEWVEDSSFGYIGAILGSYDKTYEQWKIYGIIPVSKKVCINTKINITKTGFLIARSFLGTLLPFGGAIIRLFKKK